MRSNILKKIVKNEVCVGCGLCQAICQEKIEMKYSEAGYLRPIIKENISKKEKFLLTKCCPALTIHKDNSLRTVKNDPFWGDYGSVKIGTSTSDEIETKASSGGVISSILIYLIKNRIVDYAIHIGANPDNPFDNIIKISKSAIEVIENADSRYAPSAPLKNITQLIEPNKKYVFVGKPCDVAALRQLSFYSPIISTQIKYYLSFFCFGIPSINQTKKLVNQFGIHEKDVFKLYYRKAGWPGSFQIITKDRKLFSTPYTDYMHFLFSDIQMRCKICPDGLGESADITCGDAWNDFDEKGYPSFKNERGLNIIISKTKSGEELLTNLILDKIIRIDKEVNDLRSIDKIQPGQLGKKKFHKYRIFAFLFSGKKTPIFDKYIYSGINKIAKVNIKSALYQIYGTWMRLHRK